jgi:hypothetical protein
VDSPHPPKRGNSFTRRSFVKRSGLLGGALWLAATGWDRTVGRVVAAVSPGPSAKHRKTYVALTEALSAHDSGRVPPASADAVARRFVDWYAAQDSTTQRIADSLLEDVDSSFPDGAFHRADTGRRARFVRLRATGSEEGFPHRASDPADRGTPDPALVRQIKANAGKPEYAADPTDLTNIKAVPLMRRPVDARASASEAELRRRATMLDALALVYAPLYHNPSGAIKPPPVRI